MKIYGAVQFLKLVTVVCQYVASGPCPWKPSKESDVLLVEVTWVPVWVCTIFREERNFYLCWERYFDTSINLFVV